MEMFVAKVWNILKNILLTDSHRNEFKTYAYFAFFLQVDQMQSIRANQWNMALNENIIILINYLAFYLKAISNKTFKYPKSGSCFFYSSLRFHP